MEENITTPNEPRKSSKTLMIVVGLVVLGLVGFALARSLGNDTNDEAMMDQENMMMEEMPDMGLTEAARETMPTDTMMAEDEVRIINVQGGNFYFNPNEIRVKQGEKVRIVFSGQGMPHDFVIDELDVRTPIVQSGNTATVEFTANQAGTYEYYCSVGQHRANGMFGKLIVE